MFFFSFLAIMFDRGNYEGRTAAGKARCWVFGVSSPCMTWPNYDGAKIYKKTNGMPLNHITKTHSLRKGVGQVGLRLAHYCVSVSQCVPLRPSFLRSYV